MDDPSVASHDIDPERVLRRWLAGWHWLVLFALLGALLGWGLSRLRPPAHESMAVLEIGINYGTTQPLNAASNRTAMDLVRGLLLSDAVLGEALDRLEPASTFRTQDAGVEEVRERIRLRQIGSRWELAVVGSPDEDLDGLAGAWAESSLAALTDARAQAWVVGELQTAFARLGCRLEAGATGESAQWTCATAAPGESAADLAQQVLEAVDRSRGILPGMEFYLAEEARLREQPLYGLQGTLILAGSLAGFLIGLALVLAGRSPGAAMAARKASSSEGGE